MDACKDIDLAVNTWKTMSIEVKHLQDMMTNEHITISSNSYELLTARRSLPKELESTMRHNNLNIKQL